MIADVGNIIITKIETLPFVDKISGVVRVINYKGKDGKNGSFPADCRITLDDCNKGKRYLDLMPDSSKKSVIYLEDSGLRQVSREGDIQYYNAQYNLVGWLNLPKIGVSDCSYSAKAIAMIFKRLTVPKFHSGLYQYVDIKILGQQPKSLNPFSKYSYDETVNQFLMYPFDHFVLSLDVSFKFDARCVDEETLRPIDCSVRSSNIDVNIDINPDLV